MSLVSISISGKIEIGLKFQANKNEHRKKIIRGTVLWNSFIALKENWDID
jgi:hypothetical protein